MKDIIVRVIAVIAGIAFTGLAIAKLPLFFDGESSVAIFFALCAFAAFAAAGSSEA